MATISTHHVQAAIVKAVEKGYDKNALLIQAKINPILLKQSNARLNGNQMNQLIQQVYDLLEDEFLEFTEKPCKMGAFSLMTEAIRRCETLREALDFGIRFYNLLTNDIHTELYEDEKEARIKIRFSRPDLDPDHFYLEFWMVMWHRLASWMTGRRILLLETAFIHSQPKHINELRYIFPSPHRFDASGNQLTFSVENLNLPLIRDQKAWSKFLVDAPYDLLSIPGNDQSLQHKITRIIRTLSQSNTLYFPPINEMAAQLNLSPQTLHRHLKQEATSYQLIKNNIRRDTAMTKLIQDKLPVYKVAEQLGFSDARSFTRAFRQWTGLSPREYCKFI